MCKHEELFTSN